MVKFSSSLKHLPIIPSIQYLSSQHPRIQHRPKITCMFRRHESLYSPDNNNTIATRTSVSQTSLCTILTGRGEMEVWTTRIRPKGENNPMRMKMRQMPAETWAGEATHRAKAVATAKRDAATMELDMGSQMVAWINSASVLHTSLWWGWNLT